VAGAQDGSLSLWSDSAKKAVASHGAAHGFENDTNARWVVSLAAIKMSDVVASGSYDGYVRLWRADAHGSRRIEEIGALPVRGFVNSLALSTNLIVAGSGNEHKLGRWWHIPGNLNKITVWRLHS
jgi:ribosomal RNA-processing protein 9